jgi:hypothetical protein
MHTTPNRRRPVLLPLLGLLSLLAVALAAPAFSDEAAAPAGGRWTLEFSHGPLRFVTVRSASGATASYYYMALKAKNATELPRPWNPLVESITDTKKTTLAVGNAVALDAVRNAEKNPALQCIESTAGKIEAGETKDVVAIFGPLDPNFDKIEIRVHGLVNPITIYKVEIYGEGNEVIVDGAYWKHNQEVMKRVKAAAAEAGGTVPNPTVEYREVRESRVRSITFERMGDEFGRDADPIHQVAEDWKVLGAPETLRVIHKQ